MKDSYAAAGVRTVNALEAALIGDVDGQGLDIANLIITSHQGKDIGAAHNESLALTLLIIGEAPDPLIELFLDSQPSVDRNGRLGQQKSPVEAAFRASRLNLVQKLSPNKSFITARCVSEAALVGNTDYLIAALNEIPDRVLEDAELRKRTFVKLFPKISADAIKRILQKNGWSKAIRTFKDENGTIQHEDISDFIMTAVIKSPGLDLHVKNEIIQVILENSVYTEEDEDHARHNAAYVAACNINSILLSTTILSKNKIQDPQGTGMRLLETLSLDTDMAILDQIAQDLIANTVDFDDVSPLMHNGRVKALRALLQRGKVHKSFVGDHKKDIKKWLNKACSTDDLDMLAFFVELQFRLDYEGYRAFRIAFNNRSAKVYSYFVDHADNKIRNLIISDNHLIGWISPQYEDVAVKVIQYATEDQRDQALSKAKRVGAKKVVEALLKGRRRG